MVPNKKAYENIGKEKMLIPNIFFLFQEFIFTHFKLDTIIYLSFRLKSTNILEFNKSKICFVTLNVILTSVHTYLHVGTIMYLGNKGSTLPHRYFGNKVKKCPNVYIGIHVQPYLTTGKRGSTWPPYIHLK